MVINEVIKNDDTYNNWLELLRCQQWECNDDCGGQDWSMKQKRLAHTSGGNESGF